MKLYEHQEEQVNEIRRLISSGKRKILVQLPTGGGKTIMFSTIIKKALGNGKKIGVITHRKELIKQTFETLRNGVGIDSIDIGFVMPNFKETNRKVTIGSIQTLGRRINTGKTYKFDILVIDECHHVKAKTWESVVESLVKESPDIIILGFTATPTRLDGRGLGDIFDSMAIGKPTKWLIENNFLCDYNIFVPDIVDLEEIKAIKKSGGDYSRKEAGSTLRNVITGNIVDEFKKHNANKALVFSPTIEMSKAMSDKLNAGGIKAVHVGGETEKSVREKAVKDFGEGKIKALCNVELFTEGFNVPDCDCLIIARPTKSLTIHFQMFGRVLRYKEGKVATIIDMVGNCLDPNLGGVKRSVKWKLGGVAKEKEPSLKRCNVCFAIVPIGENVCSICGNTLPKEKGKPKKRHYDTAGGDLVKFDEDMVDLGTMVKKTPPRELYFNADNNGLVNYYLENIGYDKRKARGWAYYRKKWAKSKGIWGKKNQE